MNPDPNRTMSPLPAVGGLVLAVLLVALPGLFMGIHADDWFQLKPRTTQEVLATFAGDWNKGDQGTGGFYRPMVRVTFALDHWLHGGSAPLAHLTNGFLFLLLVLGVYIGGLHLTGGRVWPPFFAVLFLVVLNPIRSEALYWLSGRTDLLAALFIFLSVSLALISLGKGRLLPAILALLLLMAGLFSKESAVAGCLILPLAAWMLRGRDVPLKISLILTIGPMVFLVVYLLARRFFLGGLGGYVVEEPRSIGLFLSHVAMALSGLFAPWQADTEGLYQPTKALPGFVFLVYLVIRAGVPRGAMFSLLAMGCTLIPLSFIAPTPMDGSRVLVLPLGFLAMALAGLFPPWRGGVLEGKKLVFVGIIGSIALLPAQIGIWRSFIVAKGPNEYMINQGNGILDEVASLAATTTVTLVVPEPPRSQPRRILDPGLALLPALEREWLLERDHTTRTDWNMEMGRFQMRFKGPGGDLRVAHALQPTLEGEVHQIRFVGADELETRILHRVSGPETIVTPQGMLAGSLSQLPREGEVLVVALEAAGDFLGQPQLIVQREGMEDQVIEGHFLRVGDGAFAWLEVSGDDMIEGVVTENWVQRGTYQLRSVQLAVYAPMFWAGAHEE